jgi:protein-tyrosine phosphatase
MTVIDFHSHILPTIDHGCQDVDECLAQLTLMGTTDTSIAVATPHFYPHIHKTDSFNTRVSRAISQIKEITRSDFPKLCVGAEVLLCEGLDSMNELHSLCIRGTHCLLIELPTHSLRRGHFDAIEAMLSDGYTVVLAHIDRYVKICGDDVDTLLSMGALAQINADALFHLSALKKINKYLETSDCICALGSDLHGAKPNAYNNFAKAPKALKEHYEVIMQRAKKLLFEAETI